MAQCPGQDMRKITAAFYRCPGCGGEVEMFSDEFRQKCRTCGTVVEKDSVPNCASWCNAAKECLGESRYKEFLKKSEKAEATENL